MAKYYDRCWNPLFGCRGCFKGCENCYAKSLMERRGRTWTDFTDVKVNKKQLYRRFDFIPQLIAVCTQSDLFQGDAGADRWTVDAVLAKCDANRHNHYLFLTKYSKNMKDYFSCDGLMDRLNKGHLEPFSLDGMAFGVSVCSIEDLHRLNDLRETPFIRHRFVAFEPLLEDVAGRIDESMLDGVEWLIVGAETGDNPRPCPQAWMVSLVEIADRKGIPVFVNAVHADGGKVTTEFEEMDARLRRGEMPFSV